MRRVGGAKMVPMPEPDLCTLWREKEDYRRRRAGTQLPPQASQPAQHAAAAAAAVADPMELEEAEGEEAAPNAQPGSLPSPPPSQLLEGLPEEATWQGRAALNWHNKPRGDISWRSPAGTVVLDLVITHPLPRSCAKVATAAGTAAHRAHSDKIAVALKSLGARLSQLQWRRGGACTLTAARPSRPLSGTPWALTRRRPCRLTWRTGTRWP